MSVCPTTNVLKSTYQHNIPTLHTNTTFQWKYSHIVEHQEFKLYHVLTQEEDKKNFSGWLHSWAFKPLYYNAQQNTDLSCTKGWRQWYSMSLIWERQWCQNLIVNLKYFFEFNWIHFLTFWYYLVPLEDINTLTKMI